MYNYDNYILFVTLVIGPEYAKKADLLIQSVTKFTKSRILIITDQIEYFTQCKKFYGNHLIIKDINEYFLFTPQINQIFNYHLKAFAIHEAIEYPEEIIFYIDADTFLFGWDVSISRYLMSHEGTLLARCRGNLSDNTDLERVLGIKLEDYNNSNIFLNFKNIHQPLIVENAFVIHKTHSETIPFIKEWKKISDFAIEHNIYPFVEAVEIAIALDNIKNNGINIKIFNIHNKTPLCDTIRTLHHDKIISTWIF